jgi:hypothetical protein
MERLERLDMNMNLTFIVGGSASKDIPVAHFGLKGGRGPEFEGLGRLHIVVAVKEDGWLAGGFEGFGVNKRVEAGGNDFNCFEAGRTKTFGDPFGGAIDVRFVFAFSTDGRDAEKFIELAKMLLAATFYKFSKVHKRPPGAMRISQFYVIKAKMMKKIATAVWSKMRPA